MAESIDLRPLAVADRRVEVGRDHDEKGEACWCARCCACSAFTRFLRDYYEVEAWVMLHVCG